MKYLNLSFLLLFVFISTGFAQTGKISGKVVDSKDNTPLESATIKIFKSGETKISGGNLSNKSGEFIIERLPYNKYNIEISFIGYETYKAENISLDASDKDLGTIKMTSSVMMTDEVVIEGEMPIMTFEGDKKVFDVGKSSLFKGGTAIDVLKKTPLIDVDADDNVSLRGSQNVKILIDDKPNRMGSLKQLPAEMIEKIEVITNPSAKYEAEGITGIVNIVLKKTSQTGYQGTAMINLGTYDKYTGGLNINYKKDEFTVFTGGWLGVQNYRFDMTSSINYLVPVSSYLNMDGKGKNFSKFLYLPLGAEYEFIQRNTIGLEGALTLANFSGSNNSRNDLLDANKNLTSYYLRNNDNGGEFNNYFVSLYYTGKLGDDKELSADLTISGNNTDFSMTRVQKDYDVFGNIISPLFPTSKEATNNKSDFITFQSDYVHPVSAVSKFEGGIKFTNRKNDNDYVYDSLDYNSGQYIRNVGTSNRFQLTDRISAGYLMFGSSYGNFSFKTGLRVEHTHSKGELLTGGQNFEKDYLNLFPSVSMTQKIGDMNQVQLAYSRRITRPNIWRMNPFKIQPDPRFIFVGNPDLNPEFTDSYELSYSLYTPIGTITPLAFLRRTKDVISQYSYLTDSNVTVITYKNASAFNSYGVDLLLNTSVLKWLNLNSTFSFYETKFDQALESNYKAEEGFSWKANIRSTFIIGDLFNLEVFYAYNGKKINAQGVGKPSSNLDLALTKTFFDNSTTITLRFTDIFKTSKWGNDVTGNGYVSSTSTIPDSRIAYLNFSYRFGNTNKYMMKQKKVKQNTNEGQDQQQDQSRPQ